MHADVTNQLLFKTTKIGMSAKSGLSSVMVITHECVTAGFNQVKSKLKSP